MDLKIEKRAARNKYERMNYLYFGSSTSVREFSNLYKCEIEYNGKKYNSLEHVYQSLKFQESDRCRFAVDGDLGDYRGLMKYKSVFYTKKTTEEQVEKKISYWQKRGCVGIIAKMASNKKYSQKLGLTYIGVEDEIFYELLPLKYSLPHFKHTLENTRDLHLIEFSRLASVRKDKWGGVVKDGKLHGENKMGKMLMHIRKDI